jgi:hypothetical protein
LWMRQWTSNCASRNSPPLSLGFCEPRTRKCMKRDALFHDRIEVNWWVLCIIRVCMVPHAIVKRSPMCYRWCVSRRAGFSRILHTRQSCRHKEVNIQQRNIRFLKESLIKNVTDCVRMNPAFAYKAEL